MSKFHLRLKELRQSRKLTQQELADKLKISKSSINMYERGEREPGLDTLEAIADLFNVDMDYLTGKSSTIKSFQEQDLDTNYLSIPGIMPLPKTSKKPRLGKIACGEPILAVENFDGYDNVPDNIQCDFTLICQGDSMINARINDGDIVYIHQQPIVENGQIAAVLIDNEEVTLKRIYIDNDSIVLSPENPKYPPKTFIKENMNRIKIIGKATGFTSILT